MRNLDAHFSCQDASLVLQCFYGLHVCGQYIACYYTEHIHSRCDAHCMHSTSSKASNGVCSADFDIFGNLSLPPDYRLNSVYALVWQWGRSVAAF